MKNVNAFDGDELSEMLYTFLWKKGHQDPLQANDKIARSWFRKDVILEEDDFPDELVRLKYYNERSTSHRSYPRGAWDWLECSYSVRVERIEKERGFLQP